MQFFHTGHSFHVAASPERGGRTLIPEVCRAALGEQDRPSPPLLANETNRYGCAIGSRSEGVSQSQLEDPRIAGGCDAPKERVHARGVRVVQVDTVQQIEELRPELDPVGF
jgi:hypothetical protein